MKNIEDINSNYIKKCILLNVFSKSMSKAGARRESGHDTQRVNEKYFIVYQQMLVSSSGIKPITFCL